MPSRIRSLMIAVALASVFPAFWHLFPRARFPFSVQMGCIVLMNFPRWLEGRKPLGPRTTRHIVGHTAYCLVVLAAMLAFLSQFPGLGERMAAWPG